VLGDLPRASNGEAGSAGRQEPDRLEKVLDAFPRGNLSCEQEPDWTLDAIRQGLRRAAEQGFIPAIGEDVQLTRDAPSAGMTLSVAA